MTAIIGCSPTFAQKYFATSQAPGTPAPAPAYNSNMPPGAITHPYGIYFGANQHRHELPRFSVSLLTPTLRAEDVPLHQHDHASFVLVLSGDYLSTADGAAPITRTPTLIFNPAGTLHRDTFVHAEGRFLAVSISDQSHTITSDWAALPTSAEAFTAQSRLNTALRLAQECASPTCASTMEALCWELLSTLLGVSLWPNKHQTSAPAWITTARDLLNDRASDTLNLTQMAHLLGLHPVYFARAFRDHLRCTPGEYRMRCRLSDALAYMRQPTASLSDIALSAGFFDQSHFSTAFRKHFGMPPKAYRRHLHGLKVQSMQETF